jgi:phospholipase/carboxylesterase
MGNTAWIRARPSTDAGHESGSSALLHLGLYRSRDALLYVPRREAATQPLPLVLSLHGAGGDAQAGLYPLHSLADQAGFLLLSVASAGPTWDAVMGTFGRDVARIEEALTWTFDRYAVDPDHLAATGFSDGASYALSLGLANGDLFRQVMAFSPGFVARTPASGQPRVFISHGTADAVLPIDSCSRRIVPSLRRTGYEVTYEEFEGPHTVPPSIAALAVSWFLTSTPDRSVH